MKIKTALIVPLLSLLVAVGVCSAAPPPFPFITNPALLLPSGCTNGQMATYVAATNRWICADNLGGGDLKSDGTVGLSAHWNAGAFNITAASFIGVLTGNASTASALAADPANCAAGQLSLGITAAGVAECSATPSLQALTLYGANSLALGSNNGGLVGSIIFKNGADGNFFTMRSGATGAAIGWTLPTAAPGGAARLFHVNADESTGYTDPATFFPYTGGTLTGRLVTRASVVGEASLKIPHGVAPTSPEDGDCWTTTAGLYCQINTATVGPYAIAGAGSGDVSKVGTPSNHQWGYWTGDGTLAGKSITASKPVCSDASGDPAVCAGTEGVWMVAGTVPTTITVADEAADSSSFPLFVTAATGDLGPKTDTAYTYDPTTGTLGATKFAGALNGTVGATTPAAGTFTSITIAKSSGVAGDMGLYEANSTDTHAAGFRGPDSITGDGAYRIKFPDARAAGAGQVLAVTNAGESGSGTAADPYVQTGSWIVPIVADGALGTPSFTALNMPSSNSDPGTTAGQMKHDSTDSASSANGTFKGYDGAQVREFITTGTNYSLITKFEYMPIRYAEDDDSVAAPAAAAEIGTTSLIARSFAEDADNGVVFFWQVPGDFVSGIKYRVYYAIGTDAGADETVVFGLSGCSVGNLDPIACSEGTQVDVTDEIGTDYDTGDLIVSPWSAAVTVTDITSGEIAKLLLIRDVSADDAVGHTLVVGIEIKYVGKINPFSDY